MGPNDKSLEARPLVNEKTLENKNKKKSKKPLWPGTHSKPKVVTPSRPPEEPLLQGGGKCVRVRRRESTGPSRSLEGWLWTSSVTEGLGLGASEGLRKEGSLEPRGEQEGGQGQ